MNSQNNGIKVGVVFGMWLPYHFSRFSRLHLLFTEAGYEVIGLQYSSGSDVYGEFVNKLDDGLASAFYSLDIARFETDFSFLKVVRVWSSVVRAHDLKVVFLPSYGNWSLTMRILCFFLRCRVIMMNESHAGTEQARGLKRWIKGLVVSSFDGALVGGEPHRRYFSKLGLRLERIKTGYDAIDNKYFSDEAAKARRNADSDRRKLCLPRRYILSLGRMVEKKNLVMLVDAFAEVKRLKPTTDLKLVFVGSGDLKAALIDRCDHHRLSRSVTPTEEMSSSDVMFYGFRQIDENPMFYALAEAFVLPSLYEEWGLVVNEAMACSLPILVSSKVGSAEDLVVPGLNGFHFEPNSPSELAMHILFLLDHPQERARMGAASLERIQDWGCENFALNAKHLVDLVCR